MAGPIQGSGAEGRRSRSLKLDSLAHHPQGIQQLNGSTSGYPPALPRPQHRAPSVEPPSFRLQATVTWAQQGGPVLCAASADKRCVSSATELKQRTPEPRPRSLFSILPVISLWHAGGGGSWERKLENPHYVGKWLSINKVRGMIKWYLIVLYPHSLGVSFLDLKARRASGRPFKVRDWSAGVACTSPLFSRGHT